jgi:hypothetical protein
MTEFRRSWHAWRAEIPQNFADLAPAKTDERPSGSFVGPIAQGLRRKEPRRLSSDPCLMSDCQHEGYLIDLGNGLTTRLCAPHRQELFRLASDPEKAGIDSASFVLEDRLCRFCGRVVDAENDPCRRCAVERSPLVQTALRLGAVPLCSCGKTTTQAGETCTECKECLPNREGQAQ